MSKPTFRKYSPFPKTLAQCVEQLTRPALKVQGLAGTRLITEWSQVVGEALARRCVPEKISFPVGKTTGGTLTIAVENGFSTELQYLQPMIMERLASYFGYKAVSRIVISHSYLPTHEESPQAPQTRPTLPADSINQADGITDPELREALQSLAKTLSGQST